MQKHFSDLRVNNSYFIYLNVQINKNFFFMNGLKEHRDFRIIVEIISDMTDIIDQNLLIIQYSA